MKIGLFGGTFDPIHVGHLCIGEWIREDFGLERVIFIPTGKPPHKSNQTISPIHDRWEMTRLSIEDNPHFSISDIEINTDKISFTIDTVRYFSKEFNLKRGNLLLIIGEDSLRDIYMWKEPEEIMHLCQIVVARRRGFNEMTTHNRGHIFPDVLYSAVPLIDISSTEIRARVKEEKSIRYMVPKIVEEYIKERDLYTK